MKASGISSVINPTRGPSPNSPPATRRSVIHQIVGPSLALVILGFVAVGSFAAWSKARGMTEMFRRKAELSASLSQDGAASGLWQYDEAALKSTLQPILADGDFKYVLVSDGHGKPFYSSGAEQVRDVAMRAVASSAAESAKPEMIESEGYLFSVVPLRHIEGAEILPLGTMVIAYDKHSVTAAVWSAIIWVVGILLIAVALFSTALIGLLRKIVTPLVKLAACMNSLSHGQLETEIGDVDRPDEIGLMARSVQVFKDNAMQLRSSEAKAAQLLEETDRQRSQTEAERAEIAAQQAEVVTAIGLGLEQLSDGKLAFRITQPFPTVYEQLKANFNGAMEQMQQTVSALLAATTTIQSGTEQITVASDDLSQRTSEQAASLKDTATALVNIAATVRKSTEGATHARDIVTLAKSDVERSGALMTEAVKAMGGIKGHSTQIGQFVGVIDQLAFQTNLLALNAGVEAARAGDSGRGFAVVASEVRALARRSADAAREIKLLISSSQEQVDRGVQLVSRTGEALGSIVRQVTDISSAVSDISSSANEQMLSLRNISDAVNQIDDVTQRNASLVQQTTASSHGLAQEASELVRLVGRFEVEQPAAAAKKPPMRSWPPTIVAAR
jgi:methyl-accepting chemotaxis protein